MDRWEYTSIKFEPTGFLGGILELDDFNRELNRFGEQGWELVSCITTHAGEGVTREVTAVFKRKK